MYGGEAFLFIVFLYILFFVILYFVVKAAVRNGIIESREEKDNSEIYTDESIGKENRRDCIEIYTDPGIGKRTCPECGCRHDFDYPKCPN
ncbi:MAG: hypothetical protein LBU77_01465, partial [Clostridiales bacterium]|nr:hypothetical protein [Clostridiales bacterium]